MYVIVNLEGIPCPYIIYMTNRMYGIVNIIINDQTFIEWHVRFTTVPLKAFYDQERIRFLFLKAHHFHL